MLKIIHYVLSWKIPACILVICLFATGCTNLAAKQKDPPVPSEVLVKKQQLDWLSSAKGIKKAAEWLDAIESAHYSGFKPDKSVLVQIRTSLENPNDLDKANQDQVNKKITDLILNFLKVLQVGNVHFDFDEVRVPRDSVYLTQLQSFKMRQSVQDIMVSLESKDREYLTFKRYLLDSITPADSLKYKSLMLSMNFHKYLIYNKTQEYIIVNIAAAEARYIRKGLPDMTMRTVVGTKKRQTPLISSYLTSIVTFPFWNVPFEIAAKELIPKVQKNENYLEQNNFEIVDAKGNLIEDSDLNWKDYNEKNFPYFFRQATGAGNSLGVLKFNLGNPFSIFLHSTSSPSSFAKDYRFLSHGCIRLEKPLELADGLLRGNIDLVELKGGKKNTESHTLKLPEKIPVFIIYMPAIVVGDRVKYLPDVYGLLKK